MMVGVKKAAYLQGSPPEISNAFVENLGAGEAFGKERSNPTNPNCPVNFEQSSGTADICRNHTDCQKNNDSTFNFAPRVASKYPRRILIIVALLMAFSLVALDLGSLPPFKWSGIKHSAAPYINRLQGNC